MKPTKQRVAITGIGMVTPLGHNTEQTWNALMDRKSGLAKVRSFDASGFTAQVAGEVKNFNPEEYIHNKKILRYCMPQTTYAIVASDEALMDAGIRPSQNNAHEWGIVVGSGLMNETFDTMQKFHDKYANNEAGEINLAKLGHEAIQEFVSYKFGQTQPNTALALMQKQYNIQGYNNSVHTACASGGHALGLAMQALRRGEAKYILAGGFDSMVNPIGMAGFCLLGALDTTNDNPTYASRPFNLTREGFVLAEGAAFMVLERFEDALARGAKIYAELAGEGNSLSSYRITDSHPSGDGAIQAIEGALKDAGITPADINYINAHGTSTKMNDFSETNAIKAVFGENAYKIPMSSTKSQTGHLISAAGALEGAICALAIHHSKIPMTMNLDKPDPDCDLDYVSDGPRNIPVKVALSNSFGFGGSNSSVVFKHPEFNKE